MNFVLYLMCVRVCRNYTLLLGIATPLSRLFHGNYNFHVDTVARQASGTLVSRRVHLFDRRLSFYEDSEFPVRVCLTQC